MATAIKNITQVGISEKQRVVYEYKTWLIFGWWVKISTEKIKNDLFVNTTEDFEEVIINDKKYIPLIQ